MKTLLIQTILGIILYSVNGSAQDTFSIVCADSTTRQVGSAGASCVDLLAFGIKDASFLSDIFPDTGAINSQAAYQAGNQENARYRMREGDTPEQIIEFVKSYDIEDNPEIRQYGIAGFVGKSAIAAGFTGSNCLNYKHHITGVINGIAYSIQGNILLGKHILDSMESRFRAAQGGITCRLMAALQGAKVIGADTRCASNRSSSLFAFVKVAKPTDRYEKPSVSESYITYNGEMVEPIDELQRIVDEKNICNATGLNDDKRSMITNVYPNPAQDILWFSSPQKNIHIINVYGEILSSTSQTFPSIEVHHLSNGLYTIRTDDYIEKIIINH